MIKIFTENQMDELMDFWLDNIKKTNDFVGAKYWEDLSANFRENYLPESETYIYEDEGKIAAFISIIEDGAIVSFFVGQPWRNQGIGKQLLDLAKSKYKILDISIYKKNQGAIEYFANRGFKVLYEQNDVNTGEAEYFMRWRNDDI